MEAPSPATARPTAAMKLLPRDLPELLPVPAAASRSVGWTELDTAPGDVEPPLLNPVQTESVRIGSAGLPGVFESVEHALGVVVFVHGAGSGHASPRSVAVARVLQRHGLSTLRFDLALPGDAPEVDAGDALARAALRVGDALGWVLSRHPRQRPRLGLFGASSGAAAALFAAAAARGLVDALVLRGGRVDLADEVLAEVTAPTLLLVGERDTGVLALNRRALGRLGGGARLAVVPGAGHLFQEPGTLDVAARWSAAWFCGHFDDGW
jgi:pimeloyl-ACP methyl ester carboxylesterase